MFLTAKEQSEIQRWSRLAIQLNGAVDSGKQAYEPSQFHVRRNGLSLLVAYTLHLIDILHATPVK